MADGSEPENAPMMPRHNRADIVWQARCLLRAATSGSLATVDDGQPFASLITPAPAPDLSLLMLLSGLSPHTRHLRVEPRCSIMVMGPPTGPNPQTAPRLSITGAATLEEDPVLRARWVARHPYAAFYADLGDFRIIRMKPTGGQFIGGFASAHRMAAEDLTPDAAAVAAVADAETFIIEHVNADHLDALARIAGSPGWRMAAVDVDGCDLIRDEDVLRVAWSAPVSDRDGVHRELIRLAQK